MKSERRDEDDAKLLTNLSENIFTLLSDREQENEKNEIVASKKIDPVEQQLQCKLSISYKEKIQQKHQQQQQNYDSIDNIAQQLDALFITKKITSKKYLVGGISDISKENKEKVKTALYGIGPQNKILSVIENDSITRKSLQRLRPRTWLNDEIIHFFLSALSLRYSEQNPNKRSHFFKSFFLTKLLEGQKYNYSNVKRWSKKVPGKDVFALDKIFFPVNIGNAHWCMVCIFVQDKQVRFYDSMGGSGRQYLDALLWYLQDEWRDKKKTCREDWDEWQLIGYTGDIPQQKNMFDCGVFTCMFADFLSRDAPLSFTQKNVSSYREYMALSILEKEIRFPFVVP